MAQALTATVALVAEHRALHAWAQYLQLMGSRALAQWLWPMGLVGVRYAGSSLTKDPTCVPFMG